MRRKEFIRQLALSSAIVSGIPVLLKAEEENKSMNGKINAWKVEIGTGLADPYCMVLESGYYIMGTHSSEYGRMLYDIYHSTDLHNWSRIGSILKHPEYEGSKKANFWAPELARFDDKFYLYYTSDSFGDPERRYVRAAVSDKVNGPYSGPPTPLTAYPSIDGHVAHDKDGTSYLFYTGNEGNPHVGQLLFDRMISPSELEKKPRRVFPDEDLEWEEGSFIIRVEDMFYLFSSQGNWRDGSYHIKVARSANVTGPWERIAFPNAKECLLESRPGMLGPGHNSVFRGLDSRYYIICHAWDEAHTGRYPWIAELAFKDGIPEII